MIAGDFLLLQQMPYFRNVQPEELALVWSQVHRRVLTAGEIIFLEGQPAEALYVVCRGRVRLFRSTVEGREQALFVVGPGATFNDVAALDGGANLANAQAIDSGTRICVLPAAVLRHLLATNPRLAVNVVGILTARVRQLAALVEDLSLRHTTQRVAKLLVEESATNGMVLLSTHEIATRVGTVREVVSRALRHLEQASAVTRIDHRTLRVDTRALHALAAAEPTAGAPQVAAR